MLASKLASSTSLCWFVYVGMVLYYIPIVIILGMNRPNSVLCWVSQFFPHIKRIFFMAGAWRQQSSASILNTDIVTCMSLCQGVFTLKGLLFSLSVFMKVVHHASCFHLQSSPDFPLTQLTAAIVWQRLLRLWPSKPPSAPSSSVSQLRSEIRLPFLQYNILFMSFQMLFVRVNIICCCLNRSGSHQTRKINRLPVIPALLEVSVCARMHVALVEGFLQCHSTCDLS